MADSRFPPPGATPPGDRRPGATPPGDRRPLAPGAGRRLRRAYLLLLVFSVLALVIIVPFPAYASVSATAQGNRVAFAVAAVVSAVSAGCLVAAAAWGRAAIDGDAALLSRARVSAALARVGGLVGWFGAPVIATVGVVQHFRGVELAFVQGVVLGGIALIPAVLNQSARRTARLVSD